MFHSSEKLSRYFSDLGIVQTSWVLPEQIFSTMNLTYAQKRAFRKGPSPKCQRDNSCFHHPDFILIFKYCIRNERWKHQKRLILQKSLLEVKDLRVHMNNGRSKSIFFKSNQFLHLHQKSMHTLTNQTDLAAQVIWNVVMVILKFYFWLIGWKRCFICKCFMQLFQFCG